MTVINKAFPIIVKKQSVASKEMSEEILFFLMISFNEFPMEFSFGINSLL